MSHLASAEERLRPVMNELAYNLESFNPAFTAVLLKVLCHCSLNNVEYFKLQLHLKCILQGQAPLKQNIMLASLGNASLLCVA